MFENPTTGEWIILGLSAAFILTTIFMLFVRNTPRDRHISKKETDQTVEEVLSDIQDIITQENKMPGMSISSNKVIYKPDGRICITPNKSLNHLSEVFTHRKIVIDPVMGTVKKIWRVFHIGKNLRRKISAYHTITVDDCREGYRGNNTKGRKSALPYILRMIGENEEIVLNRYADENAANDTAKQLAHVLKLPYQKNIF